MTSLLVFEALPFRKRRDSLEQPCVEVLNDQSIFNVRLTRFLDVALDGIGKFDEGLQGGTVVQTDICQQQNGVN